MVNVNDLYWAAGFIDGEGSFSKCGGTIAASAVQVDRWHLVNIDLIKNNVNMDIYL
jgi:hypothetical protein